MEFFVIVAVVTVITIGFLSSKSARIAGFNTALLLPVFFLAVAGISAITDTTLGRVLAFIGITIVIVIGWLYLSSDSKST
ncbi:hypothetical protein [Motiliproteus sp. MSK22-1]|uniref:hypothetical protein n=1 Tax=Motiliproteus sp. MSK22-1 TaxID=1897630 RepID=UPI0009754C3C|nr:hypothetical protein [Motiliproteus sp. MSK22-1]OMH28070.1 hypothetical protein BGP75_22145 [Motiliproteus sp. MSK22-1]